MSIFNTLVRGFLLRRINKRIAFLEQREAELKNTLNDLQRKVLPAARQQRNELMFPQRWRPTLGVSGGATLTNGRPGVK